MVDPAFSVEAATAAWLATVNGAARARSDAYFEGGYWLLLWGFVVTAIITLGVLQTGTAARLSGWAARVAPKRLWLRLLLGALPILALLTIVQLPWDAYTGFFREHQYSMSNQSFGAWFGDWAKGALIGTVAMSLLALALLRLIRALPGSWWAVGTLVTAGLMGLAIAATPLFIEPLFNTYKPMAASPLRDQILSMARANLVPATDVLVVDQSRQTKRISANVAGIGSTMRVALNDNLLAQCTPAQVRAVMGHELGHYVLDHIWSGIVYQSLIILGGFLAIHLLTPRLVARYGARWGVSGMSDPAVLPAAILVFAGYMLVMTPVLNTVTRVQEQQADQFGLNAARAPDGFAAIAMKLSTYRKLDPKPWEEAIFFDHPSGHTRVHTAMTWKAEHLGEPGVE